MAGEDSKKTGDHGEKRVADFLKMIGWVNTEKAENIECFQGEKHIRDSAKSDRQTHGLDLIYSYECPLSNYTQRDILISSKYTNEYPKHPTSLFKKYLKEMVHAMDCFYRNKERKQKKIRKLLKEKKLNGVVFWLEHGHENRDNSLIGRINNIRFSKEDYIGTYDAIYLVDNKCENFIKNTLLLAKNKFPNANSVEFYYHSTGQNFDVVRKSSSGSVLPVEHLTSGILPLKITKSNNQSVLLLSHNGDFDKDEFKRLVGLAQGLTSGWAAKIIISIPDYDLLWHSNIVNNVLSDFSDEKLKSKISVTSLFDYEEDRNE